MRCFAFGNRGARCAVFEGVHRLVLIAMAVIVCVAPMVRADPPTAADENKRKLDYNTIQQLCQKFEQVTPPPPPIEQVMVGTLDVSTGQFTWGPKIERRLVKTLITANIAPIFDTSHIRAIVPNLDPAITTLGSALGNTNTTVITGGGVGGVINGHVGGVNVGGNVGANVGGGNAVVHSGQAPPGAGQPRPATPTTPTPTPQKGKAPAGGTPSAGSGGTPTGGVTATPTTISSNADAGIWRYYAPVVAGQVDMLVAVVNRPAGARISITVDDRSASADADQIDLVVPPRVVVQFKVACADKNFGSPLTFDRPPQLGCFELEAFPLVIAYEPPGSSSSQKYTVMKQIGTTIDNFTSTETSNTKPVDTPFSTVTEMISLLNTVGQAVEKVKPEAGQAMQTASQVLSAAWGTSETDEDVTHTVSDDRRMSMSVLNSTWASTSTHQGPGKGDAFYYLVRPVFMWLVAQDEQSNSVYITISLLGYQGASSASAEDLRQGNLQLISPEMQKLMLQLDPVAPEYTGPKAGAKVTISPILQKLAGRGPSSGAVFGGRLVPADPAVYEFIGTQSGKTFQRAIAQSDTKTDTTTDTVTTKETAGFLSYIAKNVPQDGERHMKTVQSSSIATTVDDTVQVDVTFGAAQGEDHVINIFYDTLYGTFAFQEVQSSDGVDGQAMMQSQPVSNQELTLIAPDGLRAQTRTDANGNFHIRSGILQSGEYKIQIGDKEFPLSYKGSPISGLKLDLGAGKQIAGAGGGAGATPQLAKTNKPRVSGKGGGGATTQINVPEGGDTAQAIRGAPPPPPSATGPAQDGAAATAGAYSMAVNPMLKGRLGRIVIKFPDSTPCKDTHVTIRHEGSKDNAAGFYGNAATELLPGTYSVIILDKRIDGVKVQSKNDTTIATGVLHVNVSKDTHVAILDADQKTQIGAGYGAQEYGLPVGKYYVKVAGQTDAVEIKRDQVTEF